MRGRGNKTLTVDQSFFSVMGLMVAQTGVILGLVYQAIHKLSDRIDRHYENFNNQVTTLLTTIHGVDVRLVKVEEKNK